MKKLNITLKRMNKKFDESGYPPILKTVLYVFTLWHKKKWTDPISIFWKWTAIAKKVLFEDITLMFQLN